MESASQQIPHGRSAFDVERLDPFLRLVDRNVSAQCAVGIVVDQDALSWRYGHECAATDYCFASRR
jgi:hypothetical protein